ncbi:MULTISPECIES: DUF1513 domain-containing protein [Thalassolituus]|jgi:hypothetical protein|uniref:DUF1513 domain-containing protein n=1 Tax=Thalassolituus TaxID=187492 RepID=UPI0007CF72E9|nr:MULTISPECIES: DUF1513 domain-containing protein [Thalassolituus]KZY99921.1 hypothetical protein A3746_00350 [Oleibacter sp. HI0075]MAX85649.1 DUF1513 domain-containing protein [Oceanospirillaceae bacterium]|tara:strand:- start:951 stop:2120 length:1170 start_codon:yes stop_codon:yes gene_type:complete
MATSDMMTRRQILKSGVFGSTVLLPLHGLALGYSSSVMESEYWGSAVLSEDQTGFASVSRNQTSALEQTAFRGHGVCLNPTDKNSHSILMMARRPGSEGIIFDLATGEELSRFYALPERQFQGHACYSEDGSEIYVTQTIFSPGHPDHGKGMISVRDARSFVQLREFETGDPEPHEVLLMPDGIHLVVANGGRFPGQDGRSNDATEMSSSLVIIDRTTGEISQRHTLTELKASIRHLAINKEGSVVAALQVQRQALTDSDPRPLAAVLTPEGDFSYLPAPDNLWLGAHDYMGSVAVHASTDVACMTTPKGNFAVFWHVSSQTLLGYFQMHDVCGVSVSELNDCFVLSNSAGELRFIDPVSQQENTSLRQSYSDLRFDNHLSQPVIIRKG